MDIFYDVRTRMTLGYRDGVLVGQWPDDAGPVPKDWDPRPTQPARRRWLPTCAGCGAPLQSHVCDYCRRHAD